MQPFFQATGCRGRLHVRASLNRWLSFPRRAWRKGGPHPSQTRRCRTCGPAGTEVPPPSQKSIPPCQKLHRISISLIRNRIRGDEPLRIPSAVQDNRLQKSHGARFPLRQLRQNNPPLGIRPRTFWPVRWNCLWRRRRRAFPSEGIRQNLRSEPYASAESKDPPRDRWSRRPVAEASQVSRATSCNLPLQGACRQEEDPLAFPAMRFRRGGSDRQERRASRPLASSAWR